MIAIPADIKAHIEAEARRTYPNECCGIMLGLPVGADSKEKEEKREKEEITEKKEIKEIKKILPAANTFEHGEQYHRFKIEPEEFMRAEKEALQEGLDVLGFYHSHPDHPAAPSGYDGEQALPFYSYLIVAVTKAGAEDFRSWQLKEDRSEFVEEGVDFDS